MRSVATMKIAKVGYIVLSIALCIFGILLIIIPEISISAFGLFIGICLIIFGAIKITGYFSKDLYRLAFQYDLAFGIMMIALGIMVILEPNNVIETICIALGIAFLMDGFLNHGQCLCPSGLQLQTLLGGCDGTRTEGCADSDPIRKPAPKRQNRMKTGFFGAAGGIRTHVRLLSN